ncbi:MAG TPA: DUF3617 family protein [Candidatus Binataceae bacterium]|nr:DUF3617 family protein [Candidatus Binataceae bacterium]
MKRREIYALTALSALLLASAAPSVRADDIKAGKWEYTTEMSMPGMPKPPPGIQLPPGVELTPDGGMKMTRTVCLTPDQMVPQMPKGNDQCKVDHMKRDGAKVTWAITCKMPGGGAMRSKGESIYHGDTMEGTVTNVGQMGSGMMGGGGPMMGGGGQMNMTQHITGKYLGPCDQPKPPPPSN